MKILLDQQIQKLNAALRKRQEMKYYEDYDSTMQVKEAVERALHIQHQNYKAHIVSNLDKLVQGLAALDHGILPYFREIFFYLSLNTGFKESTWKSKVKLEDNFEFKNFNEYMTRFLQIGVGGESVRQRFLRQKNKLEQHITQFKEYDAFQLISASEKFLDSVARLKTTATEMSEELLGQNTSQPWKYHDFEQWALYLKSKDRIDEFSQFKVSSAMQRPHFEEQKQELEREVVLGQNEVGVQIEGEKIMPLEEQFCSVIEINQLKARFEEYLRRKKEKLML